MKKQKKEQKRFFTISKKMIALCQIPMIVICAIVALFSANALQSGIEKEIEKSLRIVAASVDETYTNLYEGDYTRDQSGKVRKGDTKISGETQLIDGLKEKTGFEVSFLYENMRLITTFQKEGGGRINGTVLEDDIYAQLATGEPLFLKDSEVSGQNYYLYYQPLVNSDGSIVGAIEVGMDSSEVKATITGQVAQILVISIIFVVAAAIVVSFMSRSMVTTMQKIKNFLGRLADGELDAKPDQKRLKQNDELGDIYRIAVHLQQTLLGIVTDIKTTTDHLTASADKLTEMAQNTQESVTGVYQAVGGISEGARTQADETADAGENVVRIGEQIRYITDQVNSLTAYAQQMAAAERESEKIILELNTSNENTRGSVSRVSEQIHSMNTSVQNINKAVSMIQDIADETDLLSLNASIEAARAGEAGRGFAVVAEQICKLADQSKQSALEIEKIIEGIMAASSSMVGIMGEVEANVNEQQDKLEETRTKYKAVSEGVENSLTNIEGIKQKMDVLSDSGTAIRDVVEGLSAISEENAASADSTLQAANGVSDTMNALKDSAENLQELADKLEEALVTFKM